VEVEWDGRKALANVRKHGIDFADALLVLHDNLAITVTDDSDGEERSSPLVWTRSDGYWSWFTYGKLTACV
jgi:uncharacterized DUF497 family protein